MQEQVKKHGKPLLLKWGARYVGQLASKGGYGTGEEGDAVRAANRRKMEPEAAAIDAAACCLVGWAESGKARPASRLHPECVVWLADAQPRVGRGAGAAPQRGGAG